MSVLKRFACLQIFSCVFTFGVAGAYAEEVFQPGIKGSVSVELENDWAYHSDDKDTDVNNLNTTIEPYLIVSLLKGLAVETSLVLEEVKDLDPNENGLFDNHGAYAEELKVTYTGDNYGVQAGKYNPDFGVAWDLAPGIYGTDMAEDYETTEKIGAGAHYTFASEAAGAHTVSANTY